MSKSFWQYYSNSLHNFGEATINLFIFLPYFFSVSSLLKTLFKPWKNLVIKKTFIGFSFTDWFNRFAFNMISRSMGFLMRSSIITFYFIFQTLFMIALPFAALLFFIFTPIAYLLSLSNKSSDEKKNIFKNNFMKKHLLNIDNKLEVEEWFEEYYQQHLIKKVWWSLQNLMSYPPLARDWAIGYTPILDQYATNLASPAYLHHIKNIVGREKEISEIQQTLIKSVDSNVIIVGEEGVGKHTIIDALAKKIYLGKTNTDLMYKRILKLNMEKILNEHTDQKQRENFIENLFDEAIESKNIILFIDEFDKYVSNQPGRIDLTTSIDKYARTGQIKIIGITTPFAYQQFVFPNEKINRIFNKIDVYEVNEKEAERIILDTVFMFEQNYKVIIPYESIREIIEKSEFYLTYIPFPEKAVDLLDTACVYVNQNRSTTITPEIINTVLTEKTHIPTIITKQLKEKLLNLETLLFAQIVQQDEAINKLSSALRRSFLLISKRKKPLASFLFLGPTGVGKTETAKALSKVFFSESIQLHPIASDSIDSINEKYLMRFDMSEFQSKYDISKLIGDGNNAGFLTRAIREQSFGVLLLDEIEKANKDLINIFLTIIDEGYFSDGQGKKVDCKNLIIIATSNAQSEDVFSTEFLNRFDGIIYFSTLNEESIRTLARKNIEKLAVEILKLYKVKIVVSEKTIDFVSQKGFNRRFGARNLERTIRDEIEDKVAKLILEDKVKPGQTINL